MPVGGAWGISVQAWLNRRLMVRAETVRGLVGKESIACLQLGRSLAYDIRQKIKLYSTSVFRVR